MKILKIFFIIILGILILMILLYYTCLHRIVINSEIKNEANKELNTKVFYSLFRPTQKVSTDFYFRDHSKDTVSFMVSNAQINPNFKNSFFLNLSSGDGFSAITLNINTIWDRSYIELNSYTDNSSFDEPKYKILEQKLTLDKSSYKEGDSIFGKIELKIKDNKKIIYNSKSFFRTRIN